MQRISLRSKRARSSTGHWKHSSKRRTRRDGGSDLKCFLEVSDEGVFALSIPLFIPDEPKIQVHLFRYRHGMRFGIETSDAVSVLASAFERSRNQELTQTFSAKRGVHEKALDLAT